MHRFFPSNVDLYGGKKLKNKKPTPGQTPGPSPEPSPESPRDIQQDSSGSSGSSKLRPTISGPASTMASSDESVSLVAEQLAQSGRLDVFDRSNSGSGESIRTSRSQGEKVKARISFTERLFPNAAGIFDEGSTLSTHGGSNFEISQSMQSSHGEMSEPELRSLASESPPSWTPVGTSLWKVCDFELPNESESTDSHPTLESMKFTRTSKMMSPLECLVASFSGAIAVAKNKGAGARNVQLIWMDKGLEELKYYTLESMTHIGPEDFHGVNVNAIEELSAAKQILTMRGEGKKLAFVFQKPEICDTFFSALSLLATVDCLMKYNGKEVNRTCYNPMLDTYNKKPLWKKKRFGDYVLLKGIGQGAFGKVYVSLNVAERMFYAVKAVKKVTRNSLDPAVAAKAFGESFQIKSTGTNERETKVMSIIHHKNVVELKDILADEERNRVLIVCELMPSGALMRTDEAKPVEPFKEPLARKFFVAALAGLEYLHDNHIAHRDIKPDNLLTQPDGVVKLSDFGTSKVYEDDPAAVRGKETSVGTPAFCAPEYAMSMYAPRGMPNSYASDMWSLGATLYFLVIGKLPFKKANILDTYDAICRDQLQFPDSPKVSKGVKECIRAMMQKRPEARATVAQVKQMPWVKGTSSAN